MKLGFTNMTEQPKNSGKFGKGNPGKPKGAVTKNTKAIKEMILKALDDAGGAEYLLECAQNEKTKTAFLGLIGKVLPMQVIGDPENPLNTSLTVTFRDAS